jgi:hypothetical protein
MKFLQTLLYVNKTVVKKNENSNGENDVLRHNKECSKLDNIRRLNKQAELNIYSVNRKYVITEKISLTQLNRIDNYSNVKFQGVAIAAPGAGQTRE